MKKRQKHNKLLPMNRTSTMLTRFTWLCVLCVCDIVMMHTEGASFLESITHGSPSEGEKAHKSACLLASLLLESLQARDPTEGSSSCYCRRMVRPRPGYSQSWRPDSNMADAGVLCLTAEPSREAQPKWQMFVSLTRLCLWKKRAVPNLYNACTHDLSIPCTLVNRLIIYTFWYSSFILHRNITKQQQGQIKTNCY